MESSSEKKLQHQSSTPKKFDLQYLKLITKNFSKDQILGHGGYGIVYKGEQEKGEVLAVKKLIMSTAGMDDKQFMNEVQHAMDFCHPNIVRLEGYCYQTEKELTFYNGYRIFTDEVHRLICFEYLPNGSLENYLSDESSGLDWHTRYNIIWGICMGLYCLHEGREGAPILHLDLKPSNILLDNTMTPKIADFGLSRLFDGGKTHISTAHVIGSRGYMAPEYIDRFILSKESDIFSLGVIIVEIVTGQRKYPEGTSSEEFIEVFENWRTRLEKTSSKTSVEKGCRQVNKCIEVGLKCMNKDPKRRPNILEIVEILNGIKSSLREDSSDGEEQSGKLINPEWRDTLDTIVSGSPEQSMEAMKAICHEISKWVDDTTPAYMIQDADLLASHLTSMVWKTFSSNMDGSSSMHRKSTLYTVEQFAQIRQLVLAVKKGTLEKLVTEMLIWLSAEEVVKMDDGSQLINSLDVAVVKILEENMDRSSLFVILCNLLRPLDPSRCSSCTPLELLLVKHNRFSALVGKYIDYLKERKDPEDLNIGDLDLDLILQRIHALHERIGQEELEIRSRNDDVLVRVMVIILAGLVFNAGPEIKGHLSRVPIDVEPKPLILTGIDHMLEYYAEAWQCKSI
ncbi:unnamed protein product [Alopecurus aequalis]